MTLYLYNTMSGRRETFRPLSPNRVGLYVCGPTVYDYAHVGNARPVVIFDILYRILKRLYLDVTYVRNITDVDDKINTKAKETGEDIKTITTRTTLAYHKDMAALNTLTPDKEPRATEHIGEMIDMIEKLLAAEVAYQSRNHVIFHVEAYPAYGALSKRHLDQQIDGARVEVADYKRHPADFVLWKPSSSKEPGWNSPWGYGRPGWHIECSAMSAKYLGKTFDIHGGGQDLIFPHHENEIAQSTCAHGGCSLAKYWIHNGYVMVEGQKMSKSLGNFYTVHQLLREFPGEAIRLLLLTTHYRQPLDFTKKGLSIARKKLDKWYGLLAEEKENLSSERQDWEDDHVPSCVFDPLLDDLNSPQALTGLDELASRVREKSDDRTFRAFKAAGRFLGFFHSSPADWFKGEKAGSVGNGLSSEEIETLVRKRDEARQQKNFATSDQIRDHLKRQGIVLEDGPEGTNWKRR